MKLIAMLYRNNEALVIEDGKQLLVADSFIRKEYVKYDDVFSQVQVGDYSYTRNFTQSEVLYFRLGHCNMRRVLNALYTSYSKLIAYGMKSYQKSRGNRGILDIDAMASNAPDFKETFEKLMNERFKTFFHAENAVLPLFNGYKYTEIGSRTYSNEGTRDIRAMVDDIFEFTALGFQISPALVSGKVAGTKDAVEQFLTFALDPLKELLEEEINRKRYGSRAIAAGSFLRIDTKAVKHVDLLSVATAVDKLISSGPFSINDIRETVGEQEINESWADAHFMTKNYETVEALLQELNVISDGNGGENDA
jgi:HK97 family phage portal protein